MNIELHKRMGMNFPFLIREGIDFHDQGTDGVLVKLKDGRSAFYDDRAGTMRILPEDSNNMTPEECRKEFGYRLFRLLLRRGWTQGDLAYMTGIQQSLISRYITGKSSPNFCHADKIAKVLGCSLDELRYIE